MMCSLCDRLGDWSRYDGDVHAEYWTQRDWTKHGRRGMDFNEQLHRIHEVLESEKRLGRFLQGRERVTQTGPR
jgi:hypothetical protein